MWSDLIPAVLHCLELNCQLSGKSFANTGDISIGSGAEMCFLFFSLSRLVLHFYYRSLLELKFCFRMKLVQVFGSKLKAHKHSPLAITLVLPLFRCSCWNWFSSGGITRARPNPTLNSGTKQSQTSSPLQGGATSTSHRCAVVPLESEPPIHWFFPVPKSRHRFIAWREEVEQHWNI